MKLFWICLIAFAPALVIGQSMQAFEGTWINEDSTQTISISYDGSFFNGELISYQSKENIIYDVNNNVDSLRSRPLTGIRVLSNFKMQSDGKLKSGKIYNFKNGNTYNGKITLKEDHMHLTGYFGIFFFLGKTQHWRKFDP